MIPKTLSPYINQARSEQREAGWEIFPAEPHLDYCILALEKGSIEVENGEKPIRIRRGDSVFLPPGPGRRLLTRARSKFHLVTFELVHIEPDPEPRPQPTPEQIWGFPIPLLIAPSFAPRFQKVVPKMVLHSQIGLASRRLDASMMCGALVSEYASWFEETRFRQLPKESLIEHAEKVARASLDAQMDVRAFATAAGLAPSRFHEVYREVRGITPYAFLLQARMEKARDLLTHSSWDIASIAAMLGYADASTFGRVFRRVHQCTPSEWRERPRTPPAVAGKSRKKAR